MVATATETSPPMNKPGGLVPTAKRVMAGMKEHNTPVAAGGVAFFALLSLVPTLVALISIYGIAFDPQDIAEQIEQRASNLPESTSEFLNDQLSAIAGAASGSLGVGLVVGIVVALWSASGGVKHLISSINHIYGYPEDRGFMKMRGLSLGLLAGTLLFIVLTSVVMGVLPVVLRRTGLGSVGGTLVSLIFWPLLALVMVAGLSFLYRVAPSRKPMMRGWWTWGGVVGTAIFFVGSIAFTLYANSLGSYSATYGIFASIIVLMLWLLIASNAVLIGAEVNAELEKQGRW